MKRIRKTVLWLLTTFMLLLVLAGCGGTGGAAQETAADREKARTEASAESPSEEITESVLAESLPEESIESTLAESLPEESAESALAGSLPEESAESALAESPSEETEEEMPEHAEAGVSEDGSYTDKESVALYLHTYGQLPDNYITKKEAQDLGWDSKAGNLWDVAPGMSIGGSRFGNYEKQLPEKKGRKYFECDIDYEGGYRGAKRLIYSNDGLIFYTEDHYKSFEQLY